MKKVLMIFGAAFILLGSVTSVEAICTDGAGLIYVDENNYVYSGDNFDGSCSDCDWNCARPL
ncbi:hypothetical protein [Litoribacter populi]|uniref:hypothetical protein n=1 Tax=Litoribacter populi TaxID=2598460 RepID=UPI0011806ED5|nr:hypothetical protein [Litoribacter populi]